MDSQIIKSMNKGGSCVPPGTGNTDYKSCARNPNGNLWAAAPSSTRQPAHCGEGGRNVGLRDLVKGGERGRGHPGGGAPRFGLREGADGALTVQERRRSRRMLVRRSMPSLATCATTLGGKIPK